MNRKMLQTTAQSRFVKGRAPTLLVSISRRLLLLMGTMLLAAGALAEEARLNLFIWSEYIEPGVVADFAKRFKCKVTIDLYEDDAAMMAKLQAGGAALYDVVVPPDHKVRALIRLNLLAPLRHGNIPNLRNLEERFRSPPYDRGNVFTVAYQWGTLGLYVRKTPGQELPSTWGLVFDPKLQPGPFVLIDSPRDLISAALRYKGWSMSSTDPQQLKEVRDLILAAKKRCVGFEGSVGAKNKVLGKMARAAIVYSGEAARGIAEDPETAYILPREGSQIWLDNLAVLAQAPHRDVAERFINYLLEPEVGARISNFTRFASPNRAAKRFIRPADLNNPVIYPPPELMARLEFLNDLGPAARLYDEVWTQIKAK